MSTLKSLLPIQAPHWPWLIKLSAHFANIVNHKQRVIMGSSLAELLIALALMGFVALAISTLLMDGGLQMTVAMTRLREIPEIQSLIIDMQKDLAQGAYVSPYSSDKQLQYTTYDTAGNAVTKMYQIYQSGANYYLRLSIDGGTSWISPYRISLATSYSLPSTARFLYASPWNDCMDFNAASSSNIFYGTEASGDIASPVSCLPNSGSSTLAYPSQATKLVLDNFIFTRTIGTASRTLISMFTMPIGTGYLRNSSTLTSPVMTDSPLVQSFATNATNFLGTGFTVGGLAWDSSRAVLAVVGTHTSTSANKIAFSERNGVLIGQSPIMVTTDNTINLTSVAFDQDNSTLLALDASAKKFYMFNPDGGPALSPVLSWGLATPPYNASNNLVNNPAAIAFDANTPDYFYVTGANPSSTIQQVFAFKKLDGTPMAGSPWSLPPAAFDGTHPAGGFFIEPYTGDFIIARNFVNNSGANSAIDIYRVQRSGLATSFSINVASLGSSATGTAGKWGLAYDPASNRIFLSDTTSNKVYEAVPPVMITQRS
jgi:hypothetical protein